MLNGFRSKSVKLADQVFSFSPSANASREAKDGIRVKTRAKANSMPRARVNLFFIVFPFYF